MAAGRTFDGIPEDGTEFESGRPDSAKPALRETTALDGLRAVLAEEIAVDAVTLEVPNRAGVSVRYDPTMTAEQIDHWRKRSQDKRKVDGVDDLRFASLICTATCQCIRFQDVDAHGEDDSPLTFSHRDLHETLGVVQAVDAVRRFYGNDAHVLSTAQAITEAAGFGDVIGQVDEDPTKGR